MSEDIARAIAQEHLDLTHQFRENSAYVHGLSKPHRNVIGKGEPSGKNIETPAKDNKETSTDTKKSVEKTESTAKASRDSWWKPAVTALGILAAGLAGAGATYWLTRPPTPVVTPEVPNKDVYDYIRDRGLNRQ